ncbi:MAG: hypothetical protein RL885_29550 [Planctomycetota bacterium]
MRLSTFLSIFVFVSMPLTIVRAQSATPAPPTARQSTLAPEYQRSVPLWSDLASLDGTLRHRSVFVQEERRAGDVVFVETADLPSWATGSDIHGLSITDASGTGKWIHRWKGPVDFSRLDFDYDQNNTEERAALDQLIQAGFDEIFLPAGDYDA